jgi:crotonobetainyl-CoA:carnitine CoA-transferase CaiB-like acyl-CoA transferase
LMDEAYAKFTTDEICERLEAEDVPYSRINLRDEIADDPQVQAMQALWTYDHPEAGEVRTPRPPAQFAATPSNIHSHTPRLGEHNAEILAELGFAEADIEGFAGRGVTFSD